METAACPLRPRSKPPSLLACTACRKKHLKCDAKLPVCTRCTEHGLDCTYLQSRRGYKGPRKNLSVNKTSGELSSRGGSTLQNGQGASSLDAPTIGDIGEAGYMMTSTETFQTSPEYDFLSTSSGGSDYLSSNDAGKEMTRQPNGAIDNQGTSFNQLYHSINGISSTDLSLSNAPNKTQSPKTPTLNTLLELYYTYFHHGHPILLPRDVFQQGLIKYPTHLWTVMQFIGSHYLGNPPDSLRSAANDVVLNSTPNDNDGFKVQSLLLLAIALHSRNEQDDAVEVLNKAIDLALALGMNHKSFARANGRGIVYLEESWRRTWWELYIMDGMISVLHQQQSFKLQTIESDMPLPCEEVDYSLGLYTNTTQTFQDFQDRAFSNEQVIYSSFTYRIEAIRLLGTILNLGPDIFANKTRQVETIDASLSAWFLSLPASKREVVDLDGQVDEMLFQAHMIINAALIYLHRPRSNLIFIRSQDQTSCTRQEAIKTPALAYHVHSVKAVRAANTLSNMVTVLTPPTKHSPFFTCAIALSAIVHLPAYSMESYSEGINSMKERLQLAIGALNSIGEIWPIAGAVKLQVTQLAREVLLSKARSPPDVTSLEALDEISVESMIDDGSWLDELSSLVPNSEQIEMPTTLVAGELHEFER